jgi:hypothetical protein
VRLRGRASRPTQLAPPRSADRPDHPSEGPTRQHPRRAPRHRADAPSASSPRRDSANPTSGAHRLSSQETH